MMKPKLTFSSLLLLALLLTLGPTAFAGNLWYVDGVHGSDQNNCRTPVTACKTIGHAIALASSGDYIVVAAATYPENLTISFNLTIAGFAVSGGPVIDGGGLHTVVTILNRAAQVTLSNLTIRNGSAGIGGGIYNNGQLTINNTTVTGNSVVGDGSQGGGISNAGTLTINNSTISHNSVTLTPPYHHAGYGGGISSSSGTLTINNSTIGHNSVFGNQGDRNGGGIASRFTFTTINNSTISENSAPNGGGLYGPATLQNSIVANNASQNCNGSMTSDGYNLSSDNSCDFHSTGDLNNTDPLLGPLQNNGGPTQTMALLSGSPAIDAGNPSGCTDGNDHLLTTDQRGMPRPDHEDSGGCDMGAYERQTD